MESPEHPSADPQGDIDCPKCGLGLPGGFTFCPRCRAQAEGRAYDPTEIDRHERQYVLSLVLLSVGALGVPRLLRSPAFSRGEKALFSALGVAQTALAFGLAYWFFFLWFPDYLKTLLAQVGQGG